MIFQIRRQRWLWPILVVFGVLPGRAFVAMNGDCLYARFGFFTAHVALANVKHWTISGPYRWWRAIGVRRTLGRAELTFGGSAHGGLCLSLREPVRIAGMTVRELYLTVDDLDGLAAVLSARGISGQDLRVSSRAQAGGGRPI
jgi:hypothetical protein